MAASGSDRAVPQPGGAEVDGDADPTVVWLWGDQDITTVASITSALREATARADRLVVVDLSEVTFMDASTLGALVRGRRAVEARGGQLSLRSPQPSHSRLLRICDLADLIEVGLPGPAPYEQRARTALETWIEVPSAEPVATEVPVTTSARDG